MNGIETVSSLNIHFTPLVPVLWLVIAIAISICFFALSFFQKASRAWPRALCAAAFLVFLSGPSLIREERQPVSDVATVIIDKSPSQSFGARDKTAEKAYAYIKEKLAAIPGLELRTVEAPSEKDVVNETRLFETIDRTLADVPKQRRAGVIMITDGQVHDVPKIEKDFDRYGPVQLLLTGRKDEKDRRVKILRAPAYGIVGQKTSIEYIVEDTDNIGESTALVTIDAHQGKPETFAVPIGEPQSLELPLAHAGQNIFEIETEGLAGELTAANNRAAAIVNGVRDRLRVLLVSGQPYAGGRTWRDMLTSDPAVDLVHFTILREPEKLDSTPSHELSLIAFPFEELFEIKLYDFDLIIFDRYRMNRILPQNYFKNMVKYVENGGAMLVTNGPSYASNDSLYFTSLMDILPGAPTGEIIKKPYKPALTNEGKMHPVTRGLSWPGKDGWGDWLRQVSLNVESGEVLMKGADEKPLIILNRVKEGRVAQIASDHIWLWSRGYEGGGPYSELLRRIVHWLMKEPELDEKALDVKVNGSDITIRSSDYHEKELNVAMTKPDGAEETVTLEKMADGSLQKTIHVDQLGIYAFENKDLTRQFAVVGDINPPELQGVKTTDENLGPLANATKAGVLWLSETPQPAIRFLGPDRTYAGYNWIGLRRNGDYTVKGVEDKPLLPAWLAAAALIGLAVFAWLREGRS